MHLSLVRIDGRHGAPGCKSRSFVSHGRLSRCTVRGNRAERTGYNVVRLLFDNAGKTTGEYEDFMTGSSFPTSRWGRPVGVAVAKHGSLFVTEDGNGTIWRVSHQQFASGI